MIWEFTALDEGKLFIDLESVVAVDQQSRKERFDDLEPTRIYTESLVFVLKDSLEYVVSVWHQFNRGVLESPMDREAVKCDLISAISEIQSGNGWVVSQGPGQLRVSGAHCSFSFADNGPLSDFGGLSLSGVYGLDFYLQREKTPDRFKELTKGIDFSKWEYLLEKAPN